MVKGIKIRPSAMIKGAYDFQWAVYYKKRKLQKFVYGSIARFPERKEINIQFIASKFQGKGHAQKFVKLLKKDVESKGYKLTSSVAVSPAWEHICKKLNIKIYD